MPEISDSSTYATPSSARQGKMRTRLAKPSRYSLSGPVIATSFGSFIVRLGVTDERRNIIGWLREVLGTGRDPENGGLDLA
jgi:hypothetical protein